MMNHKKVKKNPSDKLELKYVDQKYESLEAWVCKGQSNWMRLDFLLEYYLSANVNLSREYKGLLNDPKKAKQYYDLLYAKFIQETSGGVNFDFQRYLDWQRNNPATVNHALKLLNS